MIEQIALQQAQALDEFVEKHNGSFLQSSLWGRIKHDWGWHGLICRDADGAVRGTMSLLEHRLRFGKSSLFYAPRGPVAEDAASAAELLTAARRLASAHGAYLLRLDPPVDESDTETIHKMCALGFRRSAATDFSLFQARYNYHLDLRGQTPDSLYLRYTPAVRRNIRHAERSGVEIFRGGTSDLTDFCRMMAQTAQKNGFAPRPQSYFCDILTEAPENAALFLAKRNEKTLAAALTLRFGQTSSLLYCCSDSAALQYRPNDILQYYMHRAALAAGCTCFDLRGVEGEPEADNPKFGLHRFKKAFGAELVRYAGQFDLTLNRPVALLMRLYSHRPQ